MDSEKLSELGILCIKKDEGPYLALNPFRPVRGLVLHNDDGSEAIVPPDLLPEDQRDGRTDVDAVKVVKHLVKTIREQEAVVGALSTWLANAYIDHGFLPDIGRDQIEPPSPEDVIAYAKEHIHD